MFCSGAYIAELTTQKTACEVKIKRLKAVYKFRDTVFDIVIVAVGSAPPREQHLDQVNERLKGRDDEENRHLKASLRS